MENQHRLIKGYRDLSAEEIASMNRIKEIGIQLQDELNAQVKRNQSALIRAQDMDGDEAAALERFVHRSEDALFNARQFLQTGLMWAARSVANPEGF